MKVGREEEKIFKQRQRDRETERQRDKDRQKAETEAKIDKKPQKKLRSRKLIIDPHQVLDYIVAHGTLPEREVRKFVRQLILAVDHLHQSGVVHRYCVCVCLFVCLFVYCLFVCLFMLVFFSS